ncbi:hypothetical protein JDV09_20820 [Mycobacterium sp. Y57]|nr:hypothetical protein [Mycolicibacterium xanthum]MBX7434523.1 hypothetical protein [Mycolicibacterium xanthum]
MGPTTSPTSAPTAERVPVPRWLRLVLICDRAGSSWYVGTGFFFAPVLALLSPWPVLTTVMWALIGLAGLWLGLLGVAMAIGLAMVLRANQEIPEDYWRSIVDYPVGAAGDRTTGARRDSRPARRSRPASA